MNEVSRKILEQVNSVIIGKEAVTEKVLMAVLAQGHVLLEDVPGTGKTTLAAAFAKVLGLDSRRIQFTSDTMPSDIIGFSIYDMKTGELTYKPGAIMTNLLLADEINRTSSKTQSALLEAMEEGQVTVDGVSHRIPEPFCVFATQNPTGASGTQLLPDSQMDRFTVRLSIGYPAPADEREILLSRQKGNPLLQVRQVVTREELLSMQQEAANVYVKPELADYIVSLVGKTRQDPMIARGASPRATLSLGAMAKSVAYVQGRDYVLPKDIQAVFVSTCAHRLLLSAEADAKGMRAEELLESILKSTPAPRI